MKWYENLYVSESIQGKSDKIKWKIKHGMRTLDIYVIAFASNPDNLLDIIPAKELRQKSYPTSRIKIIGLAKGYEEALELTTQIIDETYQAIGKVDVWEYLKESRRTQNEHNSADS